MSALLPRVVRNTVYTGLAYLVVGTVGIVLVPVLLGAYGVVAYGLLALSRVLLPTGVLGILDMGVSETATVAIARARGGTNWLLASQQVTFLLALSAAVGTLLAVALFLFATDIAALLNGDLAFVRVLQITGLSLPVLFLALVVEGVLKGFEWFGLLRFWEAMASVLYALGALLAIWSGAGYEWVQYAFLTTLVLKTAVLCTFAIVAAQRAGLAFRMWQRPAAAEVTQRASLLMRNKLMGSLHFQAPPLVVSVLVGPSGVAVYDVITRLPRYLKPVLGLLASSVLPASALLLGAGEAERVRRLTAVSLWLVPLLVFPPVLAAMVLSKHILAIWVGEEFSANWPWLALMLVVPLLHSIQTMAYAAMSAEPEFIRQTNRIMLLMLVIQYGVSLSLIQPLGERSFILGQVLAMAVAFPLALRQLVHASGVGAAELIAMLFKLLAPGVALAAIVFSLGPLAPSNAVGASLAQFVAWCLLHWLAGYWWVLDSGKRSFVKRLASVARS